MSRREEESYALDFEQASSEAGERASHSVEGQAPLSSVSAGPSFIVGVGASAGGFEALTALIAALRKPTRMAFVVVQHLLPTQASALPELLWRATHVEVVTAEDGMRVLPNRVYVIPPNAELGIQQGVLQLMGPSSGRRPRLPIDFFLRSLAEDAGKRAVGVVLSGTGSDGTFGLRAIKEAGGLTFVQDPESAKYDGMPRSALESGVVDHCLMPEAIAEELTSIEERPHRFLSHRPPPQREEHNKKLLGLIKAAFGTDLTYYKPATIDRRTERRLTLHKIDRLEDYVKFVQSDREELRALYKDFLIGVTSFFRDPEVFDALKAKVFPRILESRRPPQQPIRIWVPACSTGEEAYSIAIALIEYLEHREPEQRVQIFGTDVDPDAIQRARRGLYPGNIALDISPERLERYFVKREAAYQISRRVRDMVVFSTQNVTSDAPFSKLDLVSCRNLLIYLQQATQRKVLRTFHYALKPGGFLLLGTSETVGDSPELFSLVDRSAKLYVSKHTSQVGFDPIVSREPTVKTSDSFVTERSAQNIAQLADRKILEMYGPPGVVINERMEILHFRGRTGPYLEPLPGAASLNILRLARPELHADLRRCILSALEHNARVVKDCSMHASPGRRAFRLEVMPITDPESENRCLLVLFHERSDALLPAETPTLVSSSEASEQPEQERIRELEQELLVTKEYLQSTVEELESVAEELRAANEELESANEELESANEELEASKEELERANEELSAVNSELEQRMLEQQQTLDDLHNVVAGVDGVVIVTDLDLKVRRFTESAERLLRLDALDVGRSVGQLNEYLGGIRLEQLCADVMETLTPVTREVQAGDQRNYLLRVTPYRTIEHAIAGAVLVFSDADAKQRSAQVRQDGAEFASKFLEIVDHPLMVLDQGLSVHWVNRAFYEYFRAPPDETLARLLQNPGVGQWADRPLADVVRTVLVNGGAFRDYSVKHVLPDAGVRTIQVSGSRIPGSGESSTLVLLSLEEDVT
jgi:two-component system CheB/CheR fusion protein